MPSPVALVTGANGIIGSRLVTGLAECGYTVHAFCRTTPQAHWVNLPNVITFLGDITKPETLGRAMDSVKVVFHAAAKLHIESPDARLVSDYERANVDGTRFVAENARREGVQHLIYYSTVKVYGCQQREPVTEAFIPQPMSLYARTKFEGEDAVRQTGLDATILRLSAVYGPQVKGSWQRLVSAIHKGRFIPIGTLQNVHSLTHIDDILAASIFVASTESTKHQTFNVIGNESPTLHEILSAIYADCGRQFPQWRIPVLAARLAVGGIEKSARLLGKTPPINGDALGHFFKDEAYSGTKLRSLGFRPVVPITEGWR